jgi:hypothetical protein
VTLNFALGLTEQGAPMAANVLRSARAVQLSVHVVVCQARHKIPLYPGYDADIVFYTME